MKQNELVTNSSIENILSFRFSVYHNGVSSSQFFALYFLKYQLVVLFVHQKK